MKKFRLITLALLLVVAQMVFGFALSAPALAAESKEPNLVYSLSVEGGYMDGESAMVVAGTQIRVVITADKNDGFFNSRLLLQYPTDMVTVLEKESEEATASETELDAKITSFNQGTGTRDDDTTVDIGCDAWEVMFSKDGSDLEVTDNTGVVAVFIFEVNEDAVGKEIPISIDADRTNTTPADYFGNGKKLDYVIQGESVTETVVAAPEGFVQFKENDPTTSRVLVKATKEFYAPFEDAVLTVTFKGNEEKTLTVTLDKAYTSVTACDETIEAGEGKGFLGVVVTGIPEDVTLVSATVTFRTAEDNVVINLGSAEV